MTDQVLPSVEGIRQAALAIDPVFLASPLIEQASADSELGLRLLVKVETLNPIRSFKGRGTAWWMTGLPDDGRPVVSASAGNFGQGLAHAASRLGRRLIIYSSTRANPLKIVAMRRLGAEVIQEGEDFDAAKAAAQAFASAHGFLFVEDGAEQRIAEGAGTIAKEISDTLDGKTYLDAIFVPLGNGALLTGIGTWMRAASPETRVIGVVATQAPAMQLSWEAKRPISTESANTSADGIAVRVPVPYALESMNGVVDDVVAVSEESISDAMRFCRVHYGLIVEPAGAAGVGALLANPDAWKGRTVASILCGSNVASG